MLLENMTRLLQDNKDIFAWIAANMPGVDLDFCCHQLTVRKGVKPIAQKKRKMGLERVAAIELQVKELLDAGFIQEVQYSNWLSNVVMVKKAKR
jgi:hypothetical protein